MAQEFKLFHNLPPELRLEIWQHALFLPSFSAPFNPRKVTPSPRTSPSGSRTRLNIHHLLFNSTNDALRLDIPQSQQRSLGLPWMLYGAIWRGCWRGYGEAFGTWTTWGGRGDGALIWEMMIKPIL